jgi:hypothetical protein
MSVKNIKNWIKQYPDQFSVDDYGALLCLICDKNVQVRDKFQVDQHVKGKTHQAKLNENSESSSRGVKRQKQQQLTNLAGPTNSDYCEKLCEAWIDANLPFNALTNEKIREVLKMQCKGNLPSESSIRKTYLPKVFNKKMTEIKNKLKGKKIWVSIDETTDVMKRFIASVVVGELSGLEEEKSCHSCCTT